MHEEDVGNSHLNLDENRFSFCYPKCQLGVALRKKEEAMYNDLSKRSKSASERIDKHNIGHCLHLSRPNRHCELQDGGNNIHRSSSIFESERSEQESTKSQCS